MPPLISPTFRVCGRDGSVKGTVMRSPVSCGRASPAPSKIKTKTDFCTVFLLKLFLPVTNFDVAVERVELQLRAAGSHAHSIKLIALVYVLAVPLFTRRRAAGQRRHLEIRVRAPVECLQPDVGRQPGSKRNIYIAVQRSEIARARRIAPERYMQRPVQRVCVSRSPHIHQVQASVDVLRIEPA